MLLFRVQLPALEITHVEFEIHFIIFYIVVPKLRGARKVSESEPRLTAVPHDQSRLCPGAAEVGGREGRRGDTLRGEGTREGEGAVGSPKKCSSGGMVWAWKWEVLRLWQQVSKKLWQILGMGKQWERIWGVWRRWEAARQEKIEGALNEGLSQKAGNHYFIRLFCFWGKMYPSW